MQYIEAPQEYGGSGPAVFLAGGISDAEQWQHRIATMLAPIGVTILNPRRRVYPQNDLAEDRRQIEWEYRHLQMANLVAFWFPPQTLCPLALFELGTCCSSQVPIVVGVDPAYSRRFDIEVHLKLRRPTVRIVNRLETLAEQVITALDRHGVPQ